MTGNSTMWRISFLLFLCMFSVALAQSDLPLPLPIGNPQPPPPYMVDNERNTHHAAPDRSLLNGPAVSWQNLTFIRKVKNPRALLGNFPPEIDPVDEYNTLPINGTEEGHLERRATTSYWLANVPQGNMPLAPSGYKFFRNVQDYGAKGNGISDDTVAINKAIVDGSRCGQKCGSTTVLGAVIYFPPGVYMVSAPIIQYYYTQFIGDVTSPPTIKGFRNFSGIALIDNDPYIPGGNGDEWYINQNQFYRQIRNFVMDLTLMPSNNTQGDQTYFPTGIHWQVAQATSLQNIVFNMPVSTSEGSTKHVGIFMENGSGGFVGNLTFNGGNIGFRAGSQQFTARDLTFNQCLTAISMVWDWGFNWQNIVVKSSKVGINCSDFGGAENQGIGSIAVIDSYFSNVEKPIVTRSGGVAPQIVLDNLLVDRSTRDIIYGSNGETILAGSPSGAPISIRSWASGRRYTSTNGKGTVVTGLVDPAPSKPAVLLDSRGKWFTRTKPQYGNLGASDFLVATNNGVKNDGTGDQTLAINRLLAGAGGKVVFFPAGIYQVSGTVFVPVGTRMVGAAWSQIRATGSYFGDENNPKVVVQVGTPGDSGIIEISDMLFTVKGATAGAILMEWWVHESTQGSAAMWDSHFRVGGATGSDLRMAECPKGSVYNECKAASMLLHLQPGSSGYFENIWAWTADHDLDTPVTGRDTSATQISIFSARGILIESQGPTWLYGTASEHNVLYQYQLLGAKNIYLGHIQTETPYYQAVPGSPAPFVTDPKSASGLSFFKGDPTFADCQPLSFCAEAWALRILNSTDIFIYSAGLYSFFQNYKLDCNPFERCQQRLFQTSYSQGLWIYNIFTKGAVEIVSPLGGIPPLRSNDTNKNSYTTEISVWLPLALLGSSIGQPSDGSGGSGNVFIDPKVWSSQNPTVTCKAPCTLILPPKTLSTTTTIVIPPTTVTFSDTFYTTGTTTADGTIFTTTDQTVIYLTSTITPKPVTTNKINVWAVTIPSYATGPYTIEMTSSIDQTPIVITRTKTPPSTLTNTPRTSVITDPAVTTTTIYLTPYPPTTTSGGDTELNTTPTTWTDGPPGPSCTAGCGSPCFLWCLFGWGPTCLLCPPPWCPGCPPIGGDNGAGGGGGGGGGPDDPSKSCKTVTATSCLTLCNPSSCTSTTCSPVVQCSATNTATITTNGGPEATPLSIEDWEAWRGFPGPTGAALGPFAAAQGAWVAGIMRGLTNGGPNPTITTPPTPRPSTFSVIQVTTSQVNIYVEVECFSVACPSRHLWNNYYAYTYLDPDPGSIDALATFLSIISAPSLLHAKPLLPRADSVECTVATPQYPSPIIVQGGSTLKTAITACCQTIVGGAGLFLSTGDPYFCDITFNGRTVTMSLHILIGGFKVTPPVCNQQLNLIATQCTQASDGKTKGGCSTTSDV
ncbi:hypothetical protein TWF679_003893 [Orbilia oligospora]|uniref:Rhamnogalacturonase A/B/Epimerase-like pectate lyase domain-containing protein n=1 Tax=Orbilia oligospora TaxID=2813651 RepID=A0A8H8UQM3_ORBOL|nr:hypothetical protein TWF679_003893 [Orbilia oligospora]